MTLRIEVHGGPEIADRFIIQFAFAGRETEFGGGVPNTLYSAQAISAGQYWHCIILQGVVRKPFRYQYI